MSRIRTLWLLAFGFLLVAGCGVEDTMADAAKRRLPISEPIPVWPHPQRGDVVGMATTHIWISQDGDVSAGSSWSTGIPPTGVAATGVLTLTGQPLDTETVVLDTKTYTFQTVLTDVDGNVLIGATASDSLDNLIAAIMLGAGSGTKYAASMTLHPTVTAVAGAGDTMDVTAKTKGTGGNSIATTETLTNGSFGGATLSGGVAAWGATDIVLVDGVASQVSMTSGLSGPAGVTVERIDITDNYKGDVGLPGTPLSLAGVSNVITMRGSGTLYYEGAGGDEIFVDSPNHLNAASLATGIIEGLYVQEGHVDVGASATFAPGSAILATFGPYATVTVAGSGNTAPHHVHCWDGRMDLGLRGPAQAGALIEAGGGLVKLHRLTGTANYAYLRQTAGVVDFDMLATNGAAIHLQLVGGAADFRKCQYVFTTVDDESYIAPGMQIIPGPATTEAILAASGIRDFRKEYP